MITPIFVLYSIVAPQQDKSWGSKTKHAPQLRMLGPRSLAKLPTRSDRKAVPDRDIEQRMLGPKSLVDLPRRTDIKGGPLLLPPLSKSQQKPLYREKKHTVEVESSIAKGIVYEEPGVQKGVDSLEYVNYNASVSSEWPSQTNHMDTEDDGEEGQHEAQEEEMDTYGWRNDKGAVESTGKNIKEEMFDWRLNKESNASQPSNLRKQERLTPGKDNKGKVKQTKGTSSQFKHKQKLNEPRGQHTDFSVSAIKNHGSNVQSLTGNGEVVETHVAQTPDPEEPAQNQLEHAVEVQQAINKYIFSDDKIPSDGVKDSFQDSREEDINQESEDKKISGQDNDTKDALKNLEKNGITTEWKDQKTSSPDVEANVKTSMETDVMKGESDATGYQSKDQLPPGASMPGDDDAVREARSESQDQLPPDTSMPGGDDAVREA